MSVYRISIPYGSIKRICQNQYMFWLATFQFLMVQLKVAQGHPMLRSSQGFQFLMVQLKASALLTSICRILISIPYGSIKSLHRLSLALCVMHFNSLWFN